MAAETERRILECVPPFLSKAKQFELLSFQIPSVIRQQKAALKVSRIQTSELETAYRRLAALIAENEHALDWFVKEIFPATELDEFLSVFRFTMLDCLRQSYAWVRQDLMLLHDILPNLDGSVDLSYQIDLLDCSLALDSYVPPGESQLTISMSEPRLVTEFRKWYRALLLDHALVYCKAEAVGHVNRQLAIDDIQGVVAQLQRTSADQEYDMTLNIQGQGGLLRIRLQKRNLLRLRYAIVQQTLKLGLVLVLSGVVVAWLCIEGYWSILFYLGIVLFSIIGSIWGRLQRLKSEVIEYERKRSTGRLAAS